MPNRFNSLNELFSAATFQDISVCASIQCADRGVDAGRSSERDYLCVRRDLDGRRNCLVDIARHAQIDDDDVWMEAR